ncbi:MAG TPA: winged helix-turn-helix domain-containing protein [Alloprevotella sp.]|nr:winged helix-turn-helix domain-containing protein [Alloprevotella sp.]
MLQEKAGELAGKIWQVLNENGQLAGKDLKKATKAKNEKDLYLGLGWLLREDKIQTSETEKDILVCLK